MPCAGYVRKQHGSTAADVTCLGAEAAAAALVIKDFRSWNFAVGDSRQQQSVVSGM